MGSADPTFPQDREGPVRSVSVGPFGIDAYAVTNARFEAFVGETGYTTEAERGGLEARRFPWGDEFREGGSHRCNVWQGVFPDLDTAEDGYSGTAPVDAFEPTGFGLYNGVGNVWEWCQETFDRRFGGPRVQQGGSYLCHASYCDRYRVSARTASEEDSGTGHLGFRLAYD